MCCWYDIKDIFVALSFYQQKDEIRTFGDVAKSVASDVMEMYNTAIVPTIAFFSIVRKVKGQSR